MRKERQLIYSEVCHERISQIIIIGDENQPKVKNPFSGLENVEFQKGYLKINIPNSNSAQEINLNIYRGDIEVDDMPTGTFRANGLVNVGSEGLVIECGDKQNIPWTEGMTDVLVILDVAEIVNERIETVVIYLAHMQNKSRLNKFHGYMKSILSKR
jgi:hypothetical protein